MNEKHASRTYGPLILLIWGVFLLATNYLTFWSKSDFKAIVGADPVYTVHGNRFGWPIKFGTQIYSRQTPVPTIELAVDVRMASWNLLLCAASFFSLLFLTWRLKSPSIAHLLELTMTIAIALTVANESSVRFGWNFWHSLLVYLFACPIVHLCARIPYHLIKRVLRAMRTQAQIAG